MVNTQLLDYIKQQLAQGADHDSVRNSLVTSGGWAQADVDEAFAVLGFKAVSNVPPAANVPIPANMPPLTSVPTPVNEQLPVSPLTPKPAKKTGDLILGIIIGIVQVPIILYFLAIIVPLLSSYIYLVIILVIAVEAILLDRNHRGHMASGIIIGTILVPILAFGACLLMLSGSNL